jgi:hypothetical protein
MITRRPVWSLANHLALDIADSVMVILGLLEVLTVKIPF